MDHICIGASFAYHFPTKHMYIYMHGLACRSYESFSRLVEDGAANDTVFLIPSIVMQSNLEQRLRVLNMWQDKIFWSERKLGIRLDYHDNTDPVSVNYTALSKELNAANDGAAYIAWGCKSTTRQLAFMDKVAKRYRTQALKNGILEEEAIDTEQLLLDTHANLRSWNTGLEDRAEYLSRRGQAVVQTVSTL
jgi:hypothetical protein